MRLRHPRPRGVALACVLPGHESQGQGPALPTRSHPQRPRRPLPVASHQGLGFRMGILGARNIQSTTASPLIFYLTEEYVLHFLETKYNRSAEMVVSAGSEFF